MQDLFIGFREFVPVVIKLLAPPSDDEIIDLSKEYMGIPNVLDDDSLREYSCQLAGETYNTHGLIKNVFGGCVFKSVMSVTSS